MWVLMLACATKDSSGRSVQDVAPWSFVGDSRMYAGQAVFNLGDLDGDGQDELGVATADDEEGSNTVLYVLRQRDGAESLAGAWARILLPADAAWLVPTGGCEEPSVAGHVGVLALGDLDGDGKGEFALAQSALDGGWVYVFSGAQLTQGAALGLPQAQLRIFGRADAWGMGVDMAAGDLDGDGRSELVLGAPITGTPAHGGEVWVLYGALMAQASGDTAAAKLGAQVRARQAGAGLGERVVISPDLDGDGLPDVVALAPACEGEGAQPGVALISSSRLNYSAGQSFKVTHDNLLALDRVLPGVGLLSLGDSDGDGSGEIAVTGWSSVEGEESSVAVFTGARARPWSDPVALFQTGSNSRVQQSFWESEWGPALLALDREYLIQVTQPHAASGWQKLDSLRMPCDSGLHAEQHRIAPGDYDGDGVLEVAVADPSYPCDANSSGWYGVVEWPEPVAE